jgi:hypothetical protein
VGYRGGRDLIRTTLLDRWFRLTSSPASEARVSSFDQANQRVRDQTNINFDIDRLILDRSRPKIPPHIERFTYRMDRHPQCAALLDRLSITARRERPICAITFGIEEDLPSIFGNTVFEYLQHKAPTCDLRAFLPPKIPLCIQWPDNCIDGEDLWRTIGTTFLDLAALDSPGNARSALERRAGSIAFGFEIDVTAWGKHFDTLISWIDTLDKCRAPQKGLALAVIVVSGSKSSAGRLQELHTDLLSRYEKDDHVLVLPMLGPIAQNEFKAWHREFMAVAADSLTEGDLASLILELFPDDAVSLRMGEIWPRVRKTMHQTWATP